MSATGVPDDREEGMDHGARVVRSETVSWCDLGPEVIVLRVRDSAYYRLGGTARDLWLCLDSPRQVGELVASMRALCAGVLERIEAETIEFLGECERLELIAVEGPGD